jgi:predicted transcriptional regulator
MNTTIPSAADVRAKLEPLTNAQLQKLADLSGVPFTTLWKVRAGETKDPRIDTVREFLPHVEKASA